MTTPNEENLSDFETMCPNCGWQVYHIMQHVVSGQYDVDVRNGICRLSNPDVPRHIIQHL